MLLQVIIIVQCINTKTCILSLLPRMVSMATLTFLILPFTICNKTCHLHLNKVQLIPKYAFSGVLQENQLTNNSPP